MTRAERLAARLGLTDPVVRRLRGRGHLHRLDLSEREALERLWRAQLAAAERERSRRRRPVWLAPSVRESIARDDR
jgi:hypothetical protein